MMSEDTVRAITPQDAAKRLAVHVRTLYRLLESGELRSFHVGRVWRIPVDAIQEYMDRASGKTSTAKDKTDS